MRTSITDLSLYMEKNPHRINLEWYHHMKCWKTFCDEGMFRRQQKKEEKGEGTSSKAGADLGSNQSRD